MKDTHRHIFYPAVSSLLIAFLSLPNSVEAQNAVVERDTARISFKQSQTILLPNFQNNEKYLNDMLERIHRNEDSDSALQFSSIRVVGAASPEGSLAINSRLSHQRAQRIFDWFSSRTVLPDSITTFDFVGRDWAGLRGLVEQDPNVPDREDVLIVLDEIISSIGRADGDTEANLTRIQNLHGGRPYKYMYNHLFPKLRYSRLYVDYSYLYPDRIFLKEMVLTPPNVKAYPQGAVTIPENFYPRSKECHPFYMGMKTNLIYDALALPSIGAEFYIGKNWSVVGNWTYGWWDKNSRHRYWRAYGGDLAFRKWFGSEATKKPLTGHHIGLYAGVVTYDFEFGGKGYMGGLPDRTLWDRCNYMAGIEYGYSLPVAKRLNIDFTLGIGWLGGKVIEYVPKDEIYIYQKTKNINWVGPTKAEISLVWLIGCDNYNRKYTKTTY